MKKTFLKVLSLCIAICMVSACTPNNAKNDKDEQGRTVISVGNWPSKEGANLDKYTNYKERFEEANPTMAIIPDTWGFDLQTFYSKAAAGQLPTVYYSNFTEISKIVEGEYYTDLSKGLKRAGYENIYSKTILPLISKNGEIVTYPSSAYSLGLAYNVELFEKAGLMNADGTPMQPKTWDEVVEFGKKIKDATGKAGFAIPTMSNCGGWLFTPIAWSYGVEFMKSSGDGKYTATFDTKECIDAMQYISDLKWKHNIFLDNSLIDYDEYYKQFALGNVGMILASGSFTDDIFKYEMPKEKIGIMAIPSGPKSHVTLVGGYTSTVSDGATEDQVDVAIKWFENIGVSPNLTEDGKQSIENNYKQMVADGKVVGIEKLQVYSDETEKNKFTLEMINKYKNIDINHVKLYNESLKDTSIELKPEEPVCAQELYSVLDKVIQEVLTNQNADIKSLISKAKADFQANYLDNLN
ncbi:MAG: extracellular solute-binding protein [Firmicutes bacterium]|nr:extracellular solute-binding protein [Bacillota bacterium]